ncbi:hypothetical protein JCM3774_006418, partial [Rhodotorula dairenensis]
FQLISADGAVIALLDRFLESRNRLTLFHYCFVPLTVISSVPIIVACCIARLSYLHGEPSGAPRAREKASAVEEGGRELLLKLPQVRLSQVWDHGHTLLDQARDRKPESSTTNSGSAYRVSDTGPNVHAHRSRRNSGLSVRSTDSKEGPHPTTYPASSTALFHLVLWATTLHLALFSVVFFMVYVFLNEDDTAQANCNTAHNLHMYRVAGGLITLFFMSVAWMFLGCVWMAKWSDDGSGYKRDGLDVVLSAARLRTKENKYKAGFMRWLRHARHVKAFWRWFIPLSLWVLWFIAYATVYVLAGNTFLMQGENMWPFGKLQAAVHPPFL